MQGAAEAAGAGGEREFVVERGGHEAGLGADVAGFFAAREIGVEADVERGVKGQCAGEGGVGGSRRRHGWREGGGERDGD